jgi:excisionase family DNA binding protein
VVEGQLLTVPDVAARLRVSEETVRSWLRSEQIRGYNLGGRSGWRVPASEVDRFLAERARKRVL